jgi:hypothetical protein
MSGIGAAPRAAVPVSNARADASRKNGAKSHGPKSAESKARAAQNALKHGLRARMYVVLPDEDAAAFAALEAALLDELAPVGALQAVLARQVAVAAWRLARADRLAAGMGLGPRSPTRRPTDRAIRAAALGRRRRRRRPDLRRQRHAQLRDAPALPRRRHGRVHARPAHVEGAPGRAGGGPAPRRSGARARESFPTRGAPGQRRRARTKRTRAPPRDSAWPPRRLRPARPGHPRPHAPRARDALDAERTRGRTPGSPARVADLGGAAPVGPAAALGPRRAPDAHGGAPGEPGRRGSNEPGNPMSGAIRLVDQAVQLVERVAAALPGRAPELVQARDATTRGPSPSRTRIPRKGRAPGRVAALIAEPAFRAHAGQIQAAHLGGVEHGGNGPQKATCAIGRNATGRGQIAKRAGFVPIMARGAEACRQTRRPAQGSGGRRPRPPRGERHGLGHA